MNSNPLKEKLQDYEAVIFDLDGTLVDSMWMWKEIDRAYLANFGIELPDNLQKEIEGMGLNETAIYFKAVSYTHLRAHETLLDFHGAL